MEDPKTKKTAPKVDPSNMSDDELRAYMASQHASEDGGEVASSGGDNGGAPAPAATETPVKSWWDKFKASRFNQVMSAQHDPVEVARSAARGVHDAGVNLGRTATEFLVDQALPGAGKGKAAGELVGKAGAKVTDAVLGKRSDDSLAQFTESATQFVSAFAALPGEGALMGLAKGAVVDYAAFDPYEAQLAELAANTKVPGLHQLGALLSVKGDDASVVARLKRSAAGAIPGVILEGLIAGARAVRAAKVLKGGATGAEKAAAEATIASSQKTAQAIAAGTHETKGAPFKVVPEDNGHFSVEHSNGTDPLEGVTGSNKLTFADEAEALQQMESANAAVASQESAGKVDFDHADVENALKTGDDPSFTVSPHNTVDDDLKFVKDLAGFIKSRRDELMAASPEFQLSVEDGKRLAQETLAKVPKDQLHPTVKALLNNSETQDIGHVAARMVLGQKGRHIMSLDAILEARPHDPVVMDELKQSIVNYFDLHQALNPGESAGARRLRYIQDNADFAGTGFQTAEEATAKSAAREAAVKEANDALDEIVNKIRQNRTDTDASTPTTLAGNGDAASAKDFSLARERARAKAALKKLQQGDLQFEHNPELAHERTNVIREEADAQRADPITLTKEERDAAAKVKTSTKNPIEELSRWLDSSENGLDKDLAKAEELVTSAKEDIAKLQENAAKRRADDPVGAFKKDRPHVEGEPVAGMRLRDVSQGSLDDANAKTIARMFKLANGEPTNVDAIFRGTQVMQKGGTARAALEVFTNSLLSGPPTWLTVTLSGQALSHMEPAVKIAAGAMGGNMAMVREGVDTMFGLWAYLGDNIKTAAMAMREGRSIINPAPTTYAIGGKIGKVIRIPGNIMMGLDEYTRVANYRAYIRAQSLKAGRAEGLEGLALAKRVDDDLRAAFDKDTGIATIPQALKYADLPTLSAPLKPGYGRALQEFTSKATAAKFVAPFIRASTNIWDYAFTSTPGLNLLFKANREIIAKGGEEAAALHARSLLATTVGLYAFTEAQSGRLTGKGPSDPQLRAAWLKDNQPYSIKIGNTWYSYNRMDPIATPLGLMADLHTFYTEQGHEHHDFEDALYASLGAIAANMGSRTYMRGIFDLSDAWSKGDGESVKKYLTRQLPSLMPYSSLSSRLNPDPYYREVDGMFDAIKSRLPYFSTTLDARYNIFGEKILKPEGFLNRAVSPITSKDATHSKVEQELLEIGKGLSPAAETLGPGGIIDLHSKEYAAKADQPSPYTRMMELIANPGHGYPSLREAMEKEIGKPTWNHLSDGTDEFPGGRKLGKLQAIKERYEARALRQVRKEYPKLDEHYRTVLRASGAAYRGGEDAVQKLEQVRGPVRR